ncbi:hypothetical protein [Novosphingobium sp.]|uniref:hypothetical protein n=1 Tax=Novosphingobium sp. TaxID=1874826 RepID=UPI0038BB2CA6
MGVGTRLGIATRLTLAALFLSSLIGAAPPVTHQFSEGQVWEYQTRPGDEGSLLKIQKIEPLTGMAQPERVFHITIIGVHFRAGDEPQALGHAPFSQAALDASVTRLSRSQALFPDAAEGIAEWRKANGGVFTITVAAAVETVARSLQPQGMAETAPTT